MSIFINVFLVPTVIGFTIGFLGNLFLRRR